jgi:hypothetical protein
MQRDLQALADLCVRLVAMRGPGGGNFRMRKQRPAPLMCYTLPTVKRPRRLSS